LWYKKITLIASIIKYLENVWVYDEATLF